MSSSTLYGCYIYLRRERQFCLFRYKVSYDLNGGQAKETSRFFRSFQYLAGMVRNSVYFQPTTVIDVIGHHCLYGHSDKVVKFVEDHRKHLEWQVYRIYRYRNQLIHEAAILPGLDNVIRCLHFYLVFVLDQMIGYFTHSGLKALNMDSFFYEYTLLLNKMNNALSLGEDKYKERLKALMNVPLYQDLVKSK